MAEGNGKFLLLLFDDGCLTVIEEGNWQIRGCVTLLFGEKKLSHILKANICQNAMLGQTFKAFFMVDIQAVIDLALFNNSSNYTPKIIRLA